MTAIKNYYTDYFDLNTIFAEIIVYIHINARTMPRSIAAFSVPLSLTTGVRSANEKETARRSSNELLWELYRRTLIEVASTDFAQFVVYALNYDR